MTSITENRKKRWKMILKAMASGGEPPARKPMPSEHQTPNPAPDKDYSEKEQPFTEGEENDPEIDDE